jgi:diguanylate cyclase (GGDEF)-like protein
MTSSGREITGTQGSQRLRQSDRLSMAPLAALMYAFAGVLVAGTLVLPGNDDLNRAGILTLAALGVGFAALIWVLRHRLPLWFFQISTASGSVIVALCVYWSGNPGSPYALLLVWVAVFSAYFFTTPQLIGQLAFAAATYAAALSVHPEAGGDGLTRWLLTIAALAVAAGIISTLVRSGRNLERERERLLAETLKLARTDHLTGLLNRRAWSEQLDAEMARAERSDRSLCVAMIDLDHFKQFNDEYGHPAGDRLLQELAVRWRSVIRPSDALARYGGEEFALLLPDCGVEEACDVVERLRTVLHRGQRCSAGLVPWDGRETPDELIARADVLLYEAKQSGRDRVEIASTSPA